MKRSGTPETSEEVAWLRMDAMRLAGFRALSGTLFMENDWKGGIDLFLSVECISPSGEAIEVTMYIDKLV